MKKIVKPTLFIFILICGACLWGCTGAVDSATKDANDSIADASASIDSITDASAIADTIAVDSIDGESDGVPEPNLNIWDDDIKITWHHITKTLYEVEFTSPKLKQDIANYIDSLAKRDEYIAESPYFELYIDSTDVSIQTRHGQDGIDCQEGIDNRSFNWILGYSIIGERIAIVSRRSLFVTNTNKNPLELRFDWYTTTHYMLEINDEGWCGFDINPEDYN
ncbi:MAG: hypothetical protein K2N16_04245 [Muribaculaceae bacterium]|nr:hypothetical protein [Muribaculaceae bacterium]